jgi:flagellar hook-associated protein 1 FlgK
MDQRDFLINEVNRSMKATAYLNPDNTVSLFAAGGQALVVGSSTAQLSTRADPLDPSKLQLVLGTQGALIPIDGATLGGGELGGLVEFRDQDLAATRARLGQMAAALATHYNRLQHAGVDATGASGPATQDMFTITPPVVTSATDNAGSARLSVALQDGALVQASDYTITRQSGSWLVTRASDNTTTSYASLPQTIDGLSIDIASGSAAVGDRFLVRSGSLMASGFSMSLSSPSKLANASSMTPQLGSTNGGDLAVQRFTHDASAANANAAVTITFTSPTTFDISGSGTGNLTGQPYTPGMSLQFNGWSMQLRGNPQAGDTLSLAPTASTASDNRNAQAMLEGVDRAISGGRSLVDQYADLIADVGSRAGIAQVAADMSSQSFADAKSVRDAVSGVNLDEEAARLLQFQQSYQAAARLIQTAQTMFDAILQAAGR